MTKKIYNRIFIVMRKKINEMIIDTVIKIPLYDGNVLLQWKCITKIKIKKIHCYGKDSSQWDENPSPWREFITIKKIYSDNENP